MAFGAKETWCSLSRDQNLIITTADFNKMHTQTAWFCIESAIEFATKAS